MPIEVWLKYPAALLAGFAVTFAATPLVRRLAIRWNVVDWPDARRIHTAPIPRAGGVAVFLGFHAACAVIFLLPWRPFVGLLTIAWWGRFAAVSSFLLLVGLWDDARGMRPMVKLAAQGLAAAGLYALDIRMGRAVWIQLPPLLDFLATLVWVLAITNAFNLIDGLDGLATGLAAMGALGMAASLLFRHLPGDVLVCLGLIGACLAFLRFNFHPASVFLGDSGSMFLGLLLATIALSTASKGTALASLGVPLLAVGVPMFDVLLAVWRRSVRRLFQGGAAPGGRRVMQADLEHLHHRLMQGGASQSRAATALYVLSAALVLVALLTLIFQTHALGIFLIAFAVGAYVVVKHLARVELWDSAQAILTGLRRPSSKVLAVILYPVSDMLILGLGCWAAVYLTQPAAGPAAFKRAWLADMAWWGSVSFLALVAAGAYRKVWSRARASDICGISAALFLSLVFSLGLAGLRGLTIGRPLVLQVVLYGGLVIPAVAGSRLVFRTIQDLVAVSSTHPMVARARPLRNVLIYGAGVRCTLFLRHRSYAAPRLHDDRRVVGLLDDDPNLHGRRVYGFPVLGGLAQAPGLLARRAIREIVLTADLAPDRRARLLDLAAAHGVRLVEWRMEERVLSPERAGPLGVPAGSGGSTGVPVCKP